jgi:hypothetical protein
VEDANRAVIALIVSAFSSEKQVALGTLEQQSLREEGRGSGEGGGVHKASASEPQIVSPWKNSFSVHPSVFFFFKPFEGGQASCFLPLQRIAP